MPEIVIGTTLTTFAMSDPGVWGSWLKNQDCDAWTFVAIETDSRGIGLFDPLLPKVTDFWSYSLNDGRTKVEMSNRNRHIAVGQNLVLEHATDVEAEWLMLLASDTAPPRGAVQKFLDIHDMYGHKAMGGAVDAHPMRGWDTSVVGLERRALHSGFLFLHRDVFSRVRCRTANARGDAPFVTDIESTGYPFVVSTDIVGRHSGPAVPYKQRYSGEDLAVRW